MAFSEQDLRLSYAAACERYGVQHIQQNSSILWKLNSQQSAEGTASLELLVGNVDEMESLCLAEFLSQAESWPVTSVDIKFTTDAFSCKTSTLLAVLNAPKSKLRHVDLSKCHLRRDYLRMILKCGIICVSLDLSNCTIKRFNMAGLFSNLQILTVERSTSITSLSSTCFDAMPKLAKLSLCGTSILNLWTTCHTLSKLSCLKELCFQRCVCCAGTGHCASRGVVPFKQQSEQIDRSTSSEAGYDSDTTLENCSDYSSEEEESDEAGDDDEDEEDDDDLMVTGDQLEVRYLVPQNDTRRVEDNQMDVELDEDEFDRGVTRESSKRPASSRSLQASRLTYICQSSICSEKYYREFMVSSLPGLLVLDNWEISVEERGKAWDVYIENFEPLANNRREKENIIEILKRQERGDRGVRLQPHKRRRVSNAVNDQSRAGFCRTLCASRMASSVWPATSTVYGSNKSSSDIHRKLKPRQFEYHPTESSLMVVGTLQGELAVINHEDDKLVAYVDSCRSQHRVLGLCWLNKDRDMFMAGSDNGVLELYSLSRMRAATLASRSSSHNERKNPAVYRYEEFDQLTSVHVNSTDEVFLASGYSKHVGLYDLRTSKQIKIFPDLHQEHINVVKFSHHSPSLFATSSFDKDIKLWDLRTNMQRPIYAASSGRGNVMVCFSHDDHFLLASAVDNEVRQYLAADGRLHMKFDIAPVNSRHNYTRSYYMNGRDYIITGSCEENHVRICCAQTGRRLRDLTLEGRGTNSSLYVQSLRGDPFKDFHLCVLVAYNHPQQKSEIVKVNMLASNSEPFSPEAQCSYSGGSVSGA